MDTEKVEIFLLLHQDFQLQYQDQLQDLLTQDLQELLLHLLQGQELYQMSYLILKP